MVDENAPSYSGGEAVAPVFPAIKIVEPLAPLEWLKKGWADLVASRFVGLFYGLVFVVMGLGLEWIYATKWQLTTGLMGGFFLVGPFICMGLYDLSRQLEQEGRASLWSSLSCWKNNLQGTGLFAVILTLAMIIWARASLLIFALSSNTSFPTMQGIIGRAFSFDNLGFVFLWLAVGAVFATVVFAISVVSPPMLLDRHTDTFTAVITSFKSLFANKLACLVWAAIVVVVIGLSLLFGYYPLLITAPLIGHASWHAYRAMVAEPGAVNS